jgi:hypothetical protein
MQYWLEPRGRAEKCFFGLRTLVSLAILALTISLANRTFEGSFDTHPTAHSATSKAKIQHRDRDAAKWFPPIAVFARFCPARISIVQPKEDRSQVTVFYDSLYNRPPPIL